MDFAVITLYLDQYFSDQRKCCKIYVNDRFKIVDHLQEHVRHIFGIDSKFCLLDVTSVPHALIPRSEDIRVLQGVSRIMVQQVSADFLVKVDSGELRHSKQLRSHIENETILNTPCKEKDQVACRISDKPMKSPILLESIKSPIFLEKTETHENVESISNITEQICEEKENLSTNVPRRDTEVIAKPPKFIIHSIEKVNIPIAKPIMNKEVEVESESKEMESVCDAESSACEAISPWMESNENITTRARKRTRKRKRATKPDTPTSVKKTFSLHAKPVETPNVKASKANHIRFSENYEDLEATLDDSSTVLSESACAQNQQSAQKDFPRKAKIVKSLPNTPINSSVINCRNYEETTSNAWEKLWREFNPQEYLNVVDLPEIDDIIAFRMLKMTESYEPELSKYIIGLVADIDKSPQVQNSCIKLQILAGFNCCAQTPSGKFELPDETFEDKEESAYLELKWMNVLEPKKIL